MIDIWIAAIGGCIVGIMAGAMCMGIVSIAGMRNDDECEDKKDE